MARSTTAKLKEFGAKTRTIDISEYFDWPRSVPKEVWWQERADEVRRYPRGAQSSWGIPFEMAGATGPNVIHLNKKSRPVRIAVNGKADYLCILHDWLQIPETQNPEDPHEGLAVGEYELMYSDGTTHIQPVRARFEFLMVENRGPAWTAVNFLMHETVDPIDYPADMRASHSQTGLLHGRGQESPANTPLLYAMPNPHPEIRIRSLTLRAFQELPLVFAGLTLYQGASDPLCHLPRRTYRVNAPGKPAKIEGVEADQAIIARIKRSHGVMGKAWLNSKHAGINIPRLPEGPEPERNPEDLIEITGAVDATVKVKLENRRNPISFSLGDAFHKGKSKKGKISFEVQGKQRQWMQIKVIDKSTGSPTPARVHFATPRGEYIAPYGHHEQINPNWFEDYGADVIANGRNYAYVSGEFTSDMPVGEMFVEINKGYEYTPIRKKINIRPGQKELKLTIDRWTDQRETGWVTADTHVHFISPQTAWLEGQAEGVNVVNLLASQWGRLFSNVGDITGRVGVAHDDTIVYVGTENRNHMLGHMSMLGTQGQPVYPMCCGGPGEAWVGDPDFMTMAEWARENKRKGGVVIRPHFPFQGNTEDPVPILNGLVDALEIRATGQTGQNFPTQEWYRYLNCGYRVAVCGGTDKMGAHCPLGWQRTYAKLDPSRPFTYANWAKAVRAGRTFASTGPIMDLFVDGCEIGDEISMSDKGGTVEVSTVAQCHWPLGELEVVYNGKIVAAERAPKGAKTLAIKTAIKVNGSGWIAARCSGYKRHPACYTAAHTSPVYIKCGESRAFNGPAAEHMLALVEGGIEYMNRLAATFDESSRKRMVEIFNEARKELKGRLVVEGGHTHHHGHGPYHTHGHGEEADHHH
jgi:hypothetical protein